DEADAGRNREIGVREQQRRNAARDGEGHIEQHQPGVLHVAKEHEQDEEDEHQNGYLRIAPPDERAQLVAVEMRQTDIEQNDIVLST
nr:hypothetical protein [Tanacetum cinerariifolium]